MPDDAQRTYEPPEADRPASAEDTLPGDRTPLPHDPYVSLRHRGFALYAVGWLLAVIGFHLQSATIGWEVFKWTDSALHLGLVGGVQVLPLLLLGWHAGVAVDRYNRKAIAAIGAALTGVCSLALAWLSWSVRDGTIAVTSAVPILYGIIFVGGIVATFTRPARAAFMPQIVPKSAFPNAVTWNASIFEIASMGGPALAGFIIALFSARFAYLIAAGSAFAFALLLIPIRNDPSYVPRRSQQTGGLLEGLRFVIRTPVMLGAITLDLLAVLLGGAVYLLPQFADKVLHVGPVGFGWLRAAPAMGAFLMALLLAHCPPMQRSGRNLLIAVAGFGVATIIFGLSRTYWLSFVALFLTGVFDNVSVVIRHTLVQLLTPDSMRGRVSAVNTIFIGSSNELGGLESGLTSWLMGPMMAVVAGGAGTLAVVAWVAVQWPQIRKLGSLHELKAEEPPEPRGPEVLPVPRK